MILLHLYPKNLKLNPQQSTFIEYAILQAKRMIALSWKKPDPPVIGTWLKAMMQCMAMEKITYFIKNKMSVLYMKKFGSHLITTSTTTILVIYYRRCKLL